jgi:hypothetical protein
MPQRRHPLAAVRRTGVVTGDGATPDLKTVLIGGDTTNPTDLPYINLPNIGDTVLLLGIPGDFVILGPISSNRASALYSERVALPSAQTIVATTETSVINLRTGVTSTEIHSDFGSAWDLTTGIWTAPILGEYWLSIYVSYAAWSAGASNDVVYWRWLSAPTGAAMALGVNGQSNNGDITLSGAFPAAGADTFDIRVFQNSGANRTLIRTGTFPRVTIKLLSTT